MANTYKDPTNGNRTAGSLGEQLVNALALILARRLAGDDGAEVAALASIVVLVWNSNQAAAFSLVKESLAQQISPGSEADVERALDGLSRSALLTREAVRDARVRQLLEPAFRDIDAARARGIARLRPDNAQAFVDDIVRKVVERVDLLAAQVTGAVEPLYGPERLLAAIDGAVESSCEPLATIIAALERIRSRAVDEEERIDRDLRDSTASLENEREYLRVVAVEAKHSFFGKDRNLGKLITMVGTTVPKLGNGRVTLLYLPLVRKGLPALIRALEDRIERLHERRRLLALALDRLNAISLETEASESESGRVLVIGKPKSAASRAAEVERVASAAHGAVARDLRDIAVFKGASSTILAEALEAAAAAVAKFASPRSLDEVLLADTDPASVALRLDGLIQAATVPVALSSNADRRFLASVRCLVLHAPSGSQLPAILAAHAGYRGDGFCPGGPADRLGALVLQPGINIQNTAVFHAGHDAYEGELADQTAPPLHTFSDKFLATLTRGTRDDVEQTGADDVGSAVTR
jgi:hypothetical protein